MMISVLKKTISLVSLLLIFVSVQASSVLDSLNFGNAHSEKQHAFNVELGEIINGEFNNVARKLLPPKEDGWRGGKMTFKMTVDSEKQNYITVKFWGGDANPQESRLMLFIDGKQVGQRHLGEVDELDIMATHPRNPGNFFYKTLPLPLNMTEGRKSVELKIELQGSIWGYGNTIEKYQKNIKYESRGIYSAYTHTNPFLKFHDNNKHVAWNERSVPEGPGEEVLEKVKQNVNKYIARDLKAEGKLHKDATVFLAKAYLIDWTEAYGQTSAIEKVVKTIDQHYEEYSKDRELAGKTWAGYGPIGEAISLLAEPLKPYLDKTINGYDIMRKDAWSQMLKASRDLHVQNRRSYTNQSMIYDMNIYKCNRGLAAISKDMAWPEEKALSLLYESIGLQPWSGKWDENEQPAWSKGKNFIQLTDQGLTKELGYVGAYGDIVNDIVLGMYNASRTSLHGEGDQKLKEQLIKIAKARAIFRYPLVDENGHRTMNLETVIGWRDWHYPGGITYDQMPSREGGPLEIAAATLDPTMLGYGQQILEDNMFFYTLDQKAKGKKYSELISLMDVPHSYEIVKNQKAQSARLPMTPGQDDFVFADPQVGAIALKHGENSLFVSLYWRARFAINNLARVHYLGPNFEYDATPVIETKFNDSGEFYTIPDLSNEPFGNRHEKFYKKEGMNLAVAGQKQPIAIVPDDQEGWKPGKENIFAGKGNFYVMEYGPYFIAMNCTLDQSYSLDIPKKFKKSKDLVESKTIKKSNVSVKPMQTIILFAE